ncbi:uncharacterized protein [Aegilops tauschii subsp. strangulata]|uniref:uncharacterized protein n=1 Tax=Aegilops tauschii subsp. strangulata TaxID=200361 RepID=UPI003CC84F5E
MTQFPNQNAHQQPAPITLPEFVRLNPSIFRNSTNPMDADDWLRDIQFEMESANVAPASYITFATFHVKGPAAQWWESHRGMLPTEVVTTWQKFQLAFRARHIPQGLMDQKKKEFCKLSQGTMTVDEYQRKFLELSRYAADDVCTDARKQEKLCEGLRPDIKLALVAHDCADFATLVSQAFRTETGLTEYQELLKRTRDVVPSSGQPAQKRRVWIPRNVHHRPAPTPRLSYVTPRLPPPPRQLTIRGEQSNAVAPLHNDGLCHKCGHPGHLTLDCQQGQSQDAPCPPVGRKKSCRNRPSRNHNIIPVAIVLGHVNHVDAEKAQKEPTIVMGTLRVNLVPAYVLFDSGASHAFVSQQFARLHGLDMENLPTPLAIQSQGSKWQTIMLCPRNQIEIGGLLFPASLFVLGPSNIDIILGMEWLTAHNALIDCATKTVQLTHLSGQTAQYSARAAQDAENQIYVLNALNASPPEGIENIPVIRDFEDVFPEELPGIAPARAVEFVIDLKPGTTPIANTAIQDAAA